MERLTADEVLGKMRKHETCSLRRTDEGELVLTVWINGLNTLERHAETTSYLGPDPKTTTFADYMKFLVEVEKHHSARLFISMYLVWWRRI